MKRPLLGIVTAFSAGILTEDIVNIPVFILLALVLTALFLSALFIKSKIRFFISIISAFLFLGAFSYEISNHIPQDHIKNIIEIDKNFPKQIVVQGRILNRPARKLTFYRKQKADFLLKAEALRIGNEWKTVSGILSVSVFNPRFDFRYADLVILEGNLSLPKPATNPGQFDYKKFLERRKIFYILKVREGDFSKVIRDGPINPVKAFAYKIKERVEALIDRFMPDLQASILDAILLGERRNIDEDMNYDFVKTGTVHILAISGLHVGLIASIFILLFKLLRLPFKLWAFLLGVLLIIYCIMVDTRPPVTRATIMILVFLLGRFLKRETDPLNSLALAAFLILFFNPQDIFDIGFQLSFLTVGAIVYFTPHLEEIFLKNSSLNVIKGRNKLRIYFLRAALVSFTAWLGSAPFIARYFNIFSPVTVIANLFVVPWMFFVLAASLTFILSGLFSFTLALIFSEVASLSIAILVKMVFIFSKIPFSYFFVKSPPWFFIAGFYAYLLLLFNRKQLGIKAKYFLITALLALNIFVWHRVFFEKQSLLKIYFLDVGKGDSILLEFPKGGTMLIDGGEGLGVDMGRLVVGRFLSYKGINKIDAVVATHPHTDHIGGLAAILKNFKVRYFIDNGDTELNPLFAECQELIRQKGIKRFVVKEGDVINGFGETGLCVLNPPAEKFYDLNDDSIALKMKYRDFSALFCADIRERAARSLLLKEDEKLASILLKVPHHGGGLGDITEEFLEKINPKIAIVSLGNTNISDSILLSLNKLGTRVYRTDRDGAIFLTIDGYKYIIKAFVEN